jgi:hypothetical protein
MSVVYNRGKYKIANQGWTSTLDVRCLVLAGASVPAGAEVATLNTVSELLAVGSVVEAAEISGLTGYARKSVTESVVEDDTNNTANLKIAGPISYAATESGTWRAVVFYAEGGGTDATRDLISLHTLTPLVTNGGPVDLTENTLGIIGQG